MLITKQLLLKLDMPTLQKFLSNFFKFEQLLSNLLASFLATFYLFGAESGRPYPLPLPVPEEFEFNQILLPSFSSPSSFHSQSSTRVY